jgi:hypothetical protein
LYETLQFTLYSWQMQSGDSFNFYPMLVKKYPCFEAFVTCTNTHQVFIVAIHDDLNWLFPSFFCSHFFLLRTAGYEQSCRDIDARDLLQFKQSHEDNAPSCPSIAMVDASSL